MKKLSSLTYLFLLVICFALFSTEDVSAKGNNYNVSADGKSCSKGNTTFSISNDTLYKEKGNSAKKKIKKFKDPNDMSSYEICVARKNRIYINQRIEASPSVLYMYNASSNQLKKLGTGISIVQIIGQYFIAESGGRTDISTAPLYLYKFTNNGVKKVKTLTNYGFDTAVYGKKFYYSSYTQKGLTKMTVYSCNPNGTKAKKICTKAAKDKEYGMVQFVGVHKNYLRIYENGTESKYYFRKKNSTKTAASHNATSYKSLSAVERHYQKTCTEKAGSGIYVARHKIKTAYGIKKALFVYVSGFSADCTQTDIFFQNGKKVMKMATISGVPYMISKNKKYISVSGSSTFSALYKYSSGKYKEEKMLTPSTSKEMANAKKAEKIWQKKYKITSSINYKYKNAIN